MPKVKIVRGLPFRIYETKQGTFKAYYNKEVIHRAKMSELNLALDEYALTVLGGDMAKLTLTQLEVHQYQKAMALLKPFGADLIEAAQYYVKANSTGKKVLTSVAVEQFVANKKISGISKAYCRYVEWQMKAFSDKFADEYLRDIEYSDLAGWLRASKESGKAFNNARGLFITFWKWCQNEGYYPTGETPPRRLEKWKETTEEVTVLSPEQLTKVIEVLKKKGDTVRETRERLKGLDWVGVAAFLGCRSEEIRRLKGEDVHLTHKVLEVAADKAKTGQRRLVPIPDNLFPLMQRLGDQERLTAYAGLAFISLAVRKEKVFKKWPKNVLRHSAISYKLAETGNVDEVAAWAGTSREKIFKNYRALRTLDGLPVTKELAEKWFKLIEQI